MNRISFLAISLGAGMSLQLCGGCSSWQNRVAGTGVGINPAAGHPAPDAIPVATFIPKNQGGPRPPDPVERARIALFERRPADALKLLRTVPAGYGAPIFHAQVLALAQDELADVEGAIATLRRASAMPQSARGRQPLVKVHLGTLLKAKGDSEAATDLYEEARREYAFVAEHLSGRGKTRSRTVETHPTVTPILWIAAAEADGSAGRVAASRIAREAFSSSDRKLEDLRNYCVYLRQAGRHDEVVRLLVRERSRFAGRERTSLEIAIRQARRSMRMGEGRERRDARVDRMLGLTLGEPVHAE